MLTQVIGVGASVVGDMASRPNWGLKELDFVFATLVVRLLQHILCNGDCVMVDTTLNECLSQASHSPLPRLEALLTLPSCTCWLQHHPRWQGLPRWGFFRKCLARQP